MNIFYNKHKRLSGWQVVRCTEEFLKQKECPLTYEQKRQLQNEWGKDSGFYGDLGLPFQAYTWEKIEYKCNPLIRLTLPLFVVFVILMTVLIRPINWVITGSWWFKSKLIEGFIKKWYVGIFGE